MKHEEIKNPIDEPSRPRCQAITKSGNPCESFALEDKGYCRYHSLKRTVTESTAGTLGYMAGLVSGVASEDFFEYLKKRAGYEHFFPPVSKTSRNFDTIKLNAPCDPQEMVVSYLNTYGSDFTSYGHDIDWVVNKTEYQYFPVHKKEDKKDGFIEIARLLTCSGSGGVEPHLVFLRSCGVWKYVGRVFGAWLEIDNNDSLSVRALSGKSWDGGEAWLDVHVYDPKRGYFVQTKKQIPGYFMHGSFHEE